MTFSEKYRKLEREFQKQVERDNIELGIESRYVHNFVPRERVDYILIAMEPSCGVPGDDDIESTQIARNFSWSVEDFLFHYSIREYLCQDGETYHLTDLAKGGMTVKDASKHRRWRYERWYPLLEKELRLLSKLEGVRIIAVGNQVARFLNRKPVGEGMKKVRHYSRVALSGIDKAIQNWREQFNQFSQSFDETSFRQVFEKSIGDVLHDAEMDTYVYHRPEGDGKCRLTESRKKLLFYYKTTFGELGN